MSSTYRKINYVEEGAYGCSIERTLYARFNATNDYVTILNDNGDTVLEYGEWGSGVEMDMGQAIMKLLTDETESMNVDEINKFFR